MNDALLGKTRKFSTAPGQLRLITANAFATQSSSASGGHHGLFGARKIWRAQNRQGHAVARSTVERLIRVCGNFS
ncbi:IS3 family transposase [Streptomyces sp. NPDC056707]|uniref:IS3 family transposase n=1 Tax=Streptomyces sp. NPDC056707 TaxID=3345919 RepID=UPI003699A377